MGNKLLQILFLLLLQYTWAQHSPREMLHGKVSLDSLVVEGIVVQNKNTGKGVRTDAQGVFAIYAKVNDTLIFSGTSLVTQRLILKENDFKVIELPIKLLNKATALDEVVISTLSGDLKRDAERIKVTTIDPKIDYRQIRDMRVTPDAQSTVENEAMPGYKGPQMTIDLLKIVDLFGGIFKKEPKEKKIVFTSNKIFQEAVREKFSPTFFTQTLQLKEEEIGLFLAYCDADSSVSGLLEVRKELELIDYLIKKREAFKVIQQENKK